MDSIHNALESAMDQLEVKESVSLETPKSEKTEFVDETPKNDAVLTVKKARKSPDPSEPTVPVAEPEVKEDQKVDTFIEDKKYPKGWSTSAKEQFDAATPEMKEYLLKREDQRNAEVFRAQEAERTIKQQAQPILETISPYVEQWKLYGVTPQQGISQLLAVGDLIKNNPVQAVQFIAQTHGVTSEELLNAANQNEPQVAPEYRQIMQRVDTAEQRAMRLEQMLQEREVEHIRKTEVDTFAEKAPYFDEVAPMIEQIIKAGLASDLETAYKMAVRGNDELYQKEIQRERSELLKKEQEDVTKAKSAGFAISSKRIAPTPVKRFKSTREAIEAAFTEHGVV